MEKRQKIKTEYSMAEMRSMTDRLITESAERLRARLRAAWAERATRKN
jgi:hypothetical protein